MLRIDKVSKTFNPNTVNAKLALDRLELTLNDGDFVTVIGGNGAGKSTILNMIAGVYPIDSGRIILNGKDISNWPEHRRARFIGRVFQDPMMGTAADMEIEENLAMAAKRGMHRGLAWNVAPDDHELFRKKVARLDLGLQDRMHSKVGLLSGGQRQALTLLMATLRQPELLLLDEHTAALDPMTARKVLTITREIVEQEHLTTLMVTHNMKDAIAIGNRLIMMDAGHVIYDVSGQEKSHLTVEDLLHRFEKASGNSFDDDETLLAK